MTNLLSDLVKKPAEIIAFVEDIDKYLSDIGLEVTEEEKKVLNSIADEWRNQGIRRNKSGGGHINFNTHTNSELLDGHWNRNSHTDHTSST